MKLFPIILGILLLITLSSCSTEKNVSVEVPFELKLGETANIEGHEFTFTEVTSDSRCPTNAECIWTGEATIVLVSKDDDNVEGNVTISTISDEAYVPLFPQTYIDTSCNGDVCFDVQPPYRLAYLISLNSLSPEPEVGKEIQPEDYVANLTIYLAM